MNEISCRITGTFLNYVSKTRPDLIKPLLKDLPYAYEHLSNTDNWIPWAVEKQLEDRIVQFYDDDMIMFRIGQSIISNRSLGIVHILFNLFMTPESVYRYTPQSSAFFTRDVVTVRVLESSPESAIIELRIAGQQSRGACLFNQGMFSAVPELFGMDAADVTEHQCVVSLMDAGSLRNTYKDNVHSGAESCIFGLKWATNKRRFFNLHSHRKQAFKDALHQLEENYEKLQDAYDKLWKSEERYRNLMENASDVIVLMDRNGVITALNKKGKHLLGYKTEELTGASLDSLLEPAHKTGFSVWLNSVAADPGEALEVVAVTKNSDQIILSMNASPISDEGIPVGYMIIARDITNEKKMSSRLVEAERFAAKGLVAAEIAHEINNSLANIETAMFISTKMQVDEQYRFNIIQEVHDEIGRMSSIVRGILEVYGSESSATQQMHINTEITKVINFTSRRLKGDGVKIFSRLCPTDPRILCNPGHLKQIVLNLIKNARDALDLSPSKSIVISTEVDEDVVWMKVHDTGSGIPEEMMDSIMTRLFTTKNNGVGLGLSICKQLVERHGGSLLIESEYGKGTTVRASFRKA